MSRVFFLSMVVVGLTAVLSPLEVKAQNPLASRQSDSPQIEPPARPNLLRELDLSPDQIRQVRRINQERKPIMQESQRRLREANEALDAAVYGNADNDAEVQARLRDVHMAQMEVLRNRTITEQSVRRVLTGEQLGKFRQLRRQFKQLKNQRGNDAEVQTPNLKPRQNMRLKRLGNKRQQRLNP